MAPHLTTRFKALPIWQRWLLTAGLGLLIYSAAGFLLLPPIVRTLAETQLTRHLGREVRIGAVRLNPYTLSATVRDMTVFEPGGENRLAAFRELFANLQSVSLLRWAPVFKEVRLDGLYAFLALQPDRTWNIADLLPASPPEAAAGAGDREPFRFSLNNIQLTGSEIHFQDGVRGQSHHVTGIDLALPFLSNLPSQVDIFVTPRFAATVNGTPFDLQGQVKPFAGSRETELLVDLRGIDLAVYMPYIPPEAGVRIRSGLLDLQLSLVYAGFEDGHPTLHSAGTLLLHDLALTDGEDRPLAALDLLRVEIGALEPLAGIVRIREVLLQAPSLTLNRRQAEAADAPGGTRPLREIFRSLHLPPPVIDIARFTLEEARLDIRDLKSAPAEGETGPPAEHTLAALPYLGVEGTRIDVGRQAVRVRAVDGRQGVFELRRLADGGLNLDLFTTPSGETGTPSGPADDARWEIDLDRLDLANCAVTGINLVRNDPVVVTVDAIEVGLVGFSTRPDVETTLALNGRINATGHFESSTTLILQPLTADTRLSLDQVDLAAFYPFLKPYTGVVLADGDLLVEGNLNLRTGADGSPALVYKGRAALREFRTLDRRAATPFLGWQALNLNGMDIGLNPTYAAIEEIRVEQPFSRVLIDEQGRLNLAVAALRAPEETANRPSESPARKESRPEAVHVPVRIGTLQARGGKITFADRSFQPGFQVALDAVDTTVSGLSTTSAEPASVDIRGRVDGHAPVAVTGRIQPMKARMAADLALDFQQIDLTAASPYAGRYVGRTIHQGKLSVKSTYRIADEILKADHAILIDQFDFGRPVASPDDLHLPVDLAVALLKDRHGAIRIDLPVSGNMADPEFSVGGIVLKAFLNLVVKAATSPFALLGGMFAGEDAGYLAFEPGGAVLTPASLEKLDALAQALYDRPALRLELAGFADPAVDTPALADLLFRRKLQVQKALRLAEEGKRGEPLEAIAIAPEEYEPLLQAAYQAEDFKKPRNFIGMVKTLPPDEAEALMRRHITVGPNDLEGLAYARSLAVKNHLLASGKVKGERVFLVKPEDALAPGKVAGQPSSRVTLGLK